MPQTPRFLQQVCFEASSDPALSSPLNPASFLFISFLFSCFSCLLALSSLILPSFLLRSLLSLFLFISFRVLFLSPFSLYSLLFSPSPSLFLLSLLPSLSSRLSPFMSSHSLLLFPEPSLLLPLFPFPRLFSLPFPINRSSLFFSSLYPFFLTFYRLSSLLSSHYSNLFSPPFPVTLFILFYFIFLLCLSSCSPSSPLFYSFSPLSSLILILSLLLPPLTLYLLPPLLLLHFSSFRIIPFLLSSPPLIPIYSLLVSPLTFCLLLSPPYPSSFSLPSTLSVFFSLLFS